MWNKIGKSGQRACAFFAVIAVSSLAFAEDISVQARVNRRHVPLNGRLQLSVDVNGTQHVQPPDVTCDGFDAQYLGPSTQVSVVNGQMSSSVSHTYLLSPTRQGTFTLGPIAVTVNGKAYQTQPIEVQVLPPASVVAQGEEPAEEAEGAPQLGDHLQLQLGVGKTKAYLNQAIPLKLQLLVGGVAVRGIEMPTLQAEGFLVKPLQQPKQSDVTISGQPYTLLEFTTEVVPLKPGLLTLGPASINCQIAQQRRSPRRPASSFADDPFADFFNHSLLDDFFGSARLVPVTVRADPVTVDVLPLPEEGKPKDFAGAIGRFTLDVTAVPVETVAGEPITLSMTVRGSGNLDAVTPPAIIGNLSGFKVYDAKPTQKPSGQEAQKVFEQVLIPTDPSATEIPAVQFSFFDPELGQYRTLTKGPIAIHVKPALVQERPSIISSPQGVMKQPAPPETLGRDIIYIKEELGALWPRGWAWHRSLWWWVLLIAPLVLLALSESLHRSYERLTADPGLARASGAFKRAMAQCRQAKQLQSAGKIVEGYAAIFRALQCYIGDRFNLPSEGLTKAELERHVQPRGVPADLFDELTSLFDQCDAARFTPASVASGQMGATISGAESVLKRLEQWKPRSGAGLLATGLLVLIAVWSEGGVCAEAPRQVPSMFQQANERYRNGTFDEAASGYRQIFERGVENGALYYNLGNALLKSGKPSEALWAYLQASAFLPRDADVQANLAYAQSLLQAGVDASAKPSRLIRWLTFRQRLTTPELAGWSAVWMWMLALAWSVSSWRPKTWRIAQPVAWVLGLLASVFLTALAAQTIWVDAVPKAVVVREPVDVKFSPQATGTAHFTLPEGAIIHVLRHAFGWVQLARADGLSGWVPEGTVKDLSSRHGEVN